MVEKITVNTMIPISLAAAIVVGAAVLFSRLVVLENKVDERVPSNLKEQLITMQYQLNILVNQKNLSAAQQ